MLNANFCTTQFIVTLKLFETNAIVGKSDNFTVRVESVYVPLSKVLLVVKTILLPEIERNAYVGDKIYIY